MSSTEKNVEQHEAKSNDHVLAGKPVTSPEENAKLERQQKLEMSKVHRLTKDPHNQFQLIDSSKEKEHQIVQDARGFASEHTLPQPDTLSENVNELRLTTAEPSPREVAKTHVGDAVSSGPAFEKQKHDFEKSHGVVCELHDGKLQYHLKGHNEPLLETENSDKGLEDADKRIHQMVVNKEAELGKKYHAKYSQNGETAGKQYVMVHGHWTVGTDDVKCREPKIGELLATEAVLQRSAPHNENVKFYFTTNELWKGLPEAADQQPVPVGGSDTTTPPGSAAIFINSDRTQDLTPLDDGYPHGTHISDHASLQYILLHEMVHHSQEEMGWNDDVYGSYGAKQAQALGWEKSHASKSTHEEWLLKDKHHHLWKKEKFEGDWIQCDVNGHPVDKDGHPAAPHHELRQSDNDMRRGALVTPLDDYFNNPREMFAEGMASYREGITDRYELKKHNPRLYRAMHDADQEEINRVHPPGKHGPSFVRDLDGAVVENTLAVQKRLAEFEKS
jgi:hypothetical protein